MMFLFRALIGVSGVAWALAFAWVLALYCWMASHDHKQQLPAIHHRPLPTVDGETIDGSSIDGPYIASTIKKKYHLPDCSYAKLMKHDHKFKSDDEAQAAGYEPCSRCLNASPLARSERRTQSQ